MCAIPVRMVGEHMHVLTQHLLRLQANHAGSGRVDEDTQALQIDPKNPLARRGQHQAQGVAPGFGNAHGALIAGCKGGQAQFMVFTCKACAMHADVQILRHGLCRLGTTLMVTWA